MKRGKLTLGLMCAMSHACRQKVHAAIVELTVFHGESHVGLRLTLRWVPKERLDSLMGCFDTMGSAHTHFPAGKSSILVCVSLWVRR